MTTIPSPTELFGHHTGGPIIGFAGQKRSGKDTAARALTNTATAGRHWRRYAYADKLKAAIRALDPLVASDQPPTGPERLSVLFQMGWDWETLKNSPWNEGARELLMRGGTEMGRETISPDVWIIPTEQQWIRDGRPPAVVTDVRFGNEASWVQRRGGIVIEIRRTETYDPNPSHASEVIDFPVDHVIFNDGTIDELHTSVRDIVAEFLFDAERAS